MTCFADDILQVVNEVLGSNTLKGKEAELTKLTKLQTEFTRLKEVNSLKKEKSSPKEPSITTDETENLALSSRAYKDFGKSLIEAVKSTKNVNIQLSVSRAVAYIEYMELGGEYNDGNYIAVAEGDRISYADVSGLYKSEGAITNLSKKLNLSVKDTYQLVRDKYMGESNKEWMTMTKVHEHIHVGAVEFMEKNPDDSKTVYVNNLYKNLLKKAQKDKTLDGIQNGYWKQDVHEFLAVAISNPDMMKYLNGIKVNNVSVLSKLVTTLLNMVGLNSNTEFAKLLNTFNEIRQGNIEAVTDTVTEKDVISETVYQLLEDTVKDKQNNTPNKAITKFIEEYASINAISLTDKLTTALLSMAVKKINDGSVTNVILDRINNKDAQQDTTDSVYVNVENTLIAAGSSNPDPEAALKAFYAAVSKPRKKLVLVHNKPIVATPPVTNTVKNLCKGN